jgi:hypothetical protein
VGVDPIRHHLEVALQGKREPLVELTEDAGVTGVDQQAVVS